MDPDQISLFMYDDEYESDQFNLHNLKAVVETHFGKRCNLPKLAEGGYHKVYDILEEDGTSLNAVARVCAPAFPVDKLQSEVATLQYIKSRTNIPVPEVYSWDSDASNKVGAEYMIMEKLLGVPANAVWDELDLEIKKVVVTQVADHLHALFVCRFDAAGSLYRDGNSPEAKFAVGPIIFGPFYRALDGFVRVKEWESYSQEIQTLRGPFRTATDFLQSPLVAEQYFVSQHRAIALEEVGSEERLEKGEKVLQKAINLCSVFPGNRQVHTASRNAENPFSIMLDDFRLSNIMIDKETGEVKGFIDFEGTTVAPIWACARIPPWLQPLDDQESSYEGGPDESRNVLRETFTDEIKNLDPTGEWISAYQTGRPYRLLLNRLCFNVGVWVDMERWVDRRLQWCRLNLDFELDDALDDEC